MTFRLFGRHCLQVAVVSLSCETSGLYLDLFVFFSCIVLSSAACSGVAGYIYNSVVSLAFSLTASAFVTSKF